VAEARAVVYYKADSQWQALKGSMSEYCRVQLLQQEGSLSFRVLAMHEGKGEVAINTVLNKTSKYAVQSELFHIFNDYGLNFVSKTGDSNAVEEAYLFEKKKNDGLHQDFAQRIGATESQLFSHAQSFKCQIKSATFFLCHITKTFISSFTIPFKSRQTPKYCLSQI